MSLMFDFSFSNRNRMNLLWGKHILIDELPHDIKTKGPLTQSCFIVLSTPTKPKVPHDKEYPLTDEVMVGGELNIFIHFRKRGEK